MKKIIFTIFFLFLIFTTKTYASEVSLVPSKTAVGINEQFYVDLMLDPKGVSVNGIEGSITIPKGNLIFIRSEDGKSMVDFWVEKPSLSGDKINFSGIISGGFDGVIDPFNPNSKLPGLILRLVFEGDEKGLSSIKTDPFVVTLNDGEGTVENVSPVDTSIEVQNIDNPFVYQNLNFLHFFFL